MRGKSVEYKNLIYNINTIKQEFRNFEEALSSEAINQRKLRVCVFLIHAEFETYFELVAKKVISSYENGNVSKKHKKKLLDSIVLYNSCVFDGTYIDRSGRIDKLIKIYKETINTNNGIKEKDVNKMLLPIGIDLSTMDPAWLTTLNSFGSLRGKMVHKNLNQIGSTIGFRDIDEVCRIVIDGINYVDETLYKNYRVR